MPFKKKKDLIHITKEIFIVLSQSDHEDGSHVACACVLNLCCTTELRSTFEALQKSANVARRAQTVQQSTGPESITLLLVNTIQQENAEFS